MGEKEWAVGGEIGSLLPTFMGSVSSEKVYRKFPLFPAIEGQKKGAIYPRYSLSATIAENIFIPLEPSPLLPFGVRSPSSPATRRFALTFFLRTCLILTINH